MDLTHDHALPALVNDIRAASRQLVREFGFLDKGVAGTDLSAPASTP